MIQYFKQTALFVFFFTLLLIVFALPLSAQESTPSVMEVTVDYSLPYPGILPDNPLYICKAVRDRVISWFISDPKQKAEFDLLLADKRLSGAFALSKEQPVQGKLIVQTISKGENYFSEAIAQATVAHRQGEEINGLLGQLNDAAKKHLQVIKGIENSLQKKDSEQLQLEATRTEQFIKQVTELRSR